MFDIEEKQRSKSNICHQEDKKYKKLKKFVSSNFPSSYYAKSIVFVSHLDFKLKLSSLKLGINQLYNESSSTYLIQLLNIHAGTK